MESRFANGVPMTLRQMRLYLQDTMGVPVAIRKVGGTTVECPFCFKLHRAAATGQQVAACDEATMKGVTLVVGGRSFRPEFGYTVYEYIERPNVNTLVGFDDYNM